MSLIVRGVGGGRPVNGRQESIIFGHELTESDQFQQSGECVVVNAFGQQTFVCALRVVERGAIAAAGLAEDLAVLLGFEWAAETLAVARQGEGQRFKFALWRVAAQPARVIDAAGHFAKPQIGQCLFHTCLGNAKHHALAAAAAEQGKHEAGAFWCASVDGAPHLQCAVPAMNAGRAALSEFKLRPPDERAVTEDP